MSKWFNAVCLVILGGTAVAVSVLLIIEAIDRYYSGKR